MGGSLGVVGAGAAGCALVLRLRQLGWRGPIDLFEAGRGPGGRASTRRSRHDAGLRLDHGAPLFHLSTTPGPVVCSALLEGNWIEPWRGSVRILDGAGQLHAPPEGPPAGTALRGRGGMDQLCRGLLAMAVPAAREHFQTLVRHLVSTPSGGWRLLDGDSRPLAEVDWLVLSGHLLGSPRCRALFGWPEVPLQEAGLQRADPLLDRAIAALDGLACLSRHNLLMVVPAQASAPWRELPFRLLEFNADAERLWGFSRLSIQPLDDERCAVVAHASPAIAAEALPLATALRRTLQEVCGPGIPVEGAMEVMRWGAALPLAPGLDPGLCLCRRSRIGFCGDYVAGEGFGRLEGALLSAERLAAELVAVMGGGSER